MSVVAKTANESVKKTVRSTIMGTGSVGTVWGVGVLFDVAKNKISELSVPELAVYVVPVLLLVALGWHCVGKFGCKRHSSSTYYCRSIGSALLTALLGKRTLLRTLFWLWCCAVNLIMLFVLADCGMDQFCDEAEFSVYYENYVLNYGLPMGTGHVTNECVAGWYRFDFVGTHDVSDEAKCLYGENRRYKFGWLDRYRTLRRVTQVNGKGDPLWFCDNGNDDGDTPVLEFAYASQADMTSGGAVPARLQVYYETIDQLYGLQALYACNYWDRWGEPNAFVTLTKGFADERYFVPGTSFDTRIGVPGRSNVSGYAVKWDENGRQIERKCVAGRDVDGVVRKTYDYEVVPLGNGDEFTYVSSRKHFGIEEGEESLFYKQETTWVGLCCTVRNFNGQGCEESRWTCRSRSLSMAMRLERFDVDERFERIEDERGDIRGCVVKYRYDEWGNRALAEFFSDVDCSHPFLRQDELFAVERFSWTEDGLLATRETFDEQGRPMLALTVKNRPVSRIEWIYGQGCLTTRGYDGAKVVKNITSYLSQAQRSVQLTKNTVSLTSEFDDGKHRIVEVVTRTADGKEKDNEHGFSMCRSVYYKENRDEDEYPNGRMASLEYFSADGALSTNAVSQYFTYRQGLLARVDYKIGCVKDGRIVPHQFDFYLTSSGEYMPAVAIMEHNEQNRVVCEWRLDRNECTNSLPRDMAYCIEYEYDDANVSLLRTIITSAEAVQTNDFQNADLGVD